MMVKRSDFYWQANNTVQFNGANGMRRRLFCEPTERRDGSVTLLLRNFDSPFRDTRLTLSPRNAGWLGERLGKRLESIVNATGCLGRLHVTPHDDGTVTVAVEYVEGAGSIDLTRDTAAIFADWLRRMAARQFSEVA